MAKKQEQNGVNGRQVRILEVLAKGGEKTRGDLQEATGIVKGYARLIGAADKGSVHPDSLVARGYVTLNTYEGDRNIYQKITAAGKKALAAAKKAATAKAKPTKKAAASKGKPTKKASGKKTAEKATTKKRTTKKAAK